MEITVWPYSAELEIDYSALTVKAVEWKKNLYYDICPNKDILNKDIILITDSIKKMFSKRINTLKKAPKPKRDRSIPLKIWF